MTGAGLKRIILAGVMACFVQPVLAQSSPEGAEIIFLPFYVDETGNGLLQFEHPDEATGEIWLAFGTRTGKAERPFEPWVGEIGPYSGPEITVAFSYLWNRQFPLEDVAFSIYQRDPFVSLAYFEAVVSPEDAVPEESCASITMLGECLN